MPLLIIIVLEVVLIILLTNGFKKLKFIVLEQKKSEHPVYQLPDEGMKKIESVFKDYISKGLNEVIIRDRESGAVLSRRHPNDPEMQDILSDPTKIVEN